MGDMPCIWCLLYVQAPPNRVALVHAYNPGEHDSQGPVENWAHAVDLVYNKGLILRDQHGDRCGLGAHTLISGDAVCLGHAVAVMRSRVA